MRAASAAYALLALGVALGAARAPAAELFYLDHDAFTGDYVGPTGPLVLSGEIASGDYDRLLARILGDEPRFLAQNKLILASDGGDVREALKIADLVKSLYTRVIVGPLTGRCVSACFFIYAAAAEREADGDRLLGVNRPFIDAAGEPAAAKAVAGSPPTAGTEAGALAGVRAFLRDNEVPDYLVEEMFRRGSDQLYWLSPQDAASLGFKSGSFARLLAARCGWDAGREREALAGKRPLDELKQTVECRGRLTRTGAHEALLKAANSLHTPPH